MLREVRRAHNAHDDDLCLSSGTGTDCCAAAVVLLHTKRGTFDLDFVLNNRLSKQAKDSYCSPGRDVSSSHRAPPDIRTRTRYGGNLLAIVNGNAPCLEPILNNGDDTEVLDGNSMMSCRNCIACYPFDSLVQCTEGHLFCNQCVQYFAKQTIYGDGLSKLKCGINTSGGVCEGYLSEQIASISVGGVDFTSTRWDASALYQLNAKLELRNRFPYLKVGGIDKLFKENKHHFFPTYTAIYECTEFIWIVWTSTWLKRWHCLTTNPILMSAWPIWVCSSGKHSIEMGHFMAFCLACLLSEVFRTCR